MNVVEHVFVIQLRGEQSGRGRCKSHDAIIR